MIAWLLAPAPIAFADTPPAVAADTTQSPGLLRGSNVRTTAAGSGEARLSESRCAELDAVLDENLNSARALFSRLFDLQVPLGEAREAVDEARVACRRLMQALSRCLELPQLEGLE